MPCAGAWVAAEVGIVAQRIFRLPWGAVGFDRMHELMSRVHPFGWHASIQLDGRELPQWEDTIKRLPGKFVIDHSGKYLEPSPRSRRCSRRCCICRALVKHAPERPTR